MLCKLGQGQGRQGRGLLVQGRDEGRHVQPRPGQVNSDDKRLIISVLTKDINNEHLQFKM